MNGTLYKHMVRGNLTSIASYTIGSVFYMFLMVWIYPSLAQNAKSLNNMLKAMPSGLTNAFGYQNGFVSFESYMSGEFYGLLLILILTIYCMMFPTQLVARLVDNGAMAYLLSTPNTRSKIIVTQGLVFFTGIFLIMLITTLSGLIGYEIFIHNKNEFHLLKFLQMNLGAFLLSFAVGGISFLISCSMNDEKKALGTAGIIVFGFFSLDIIGKISNQIDWLRHFTIYSLFRPSEIVSGNAHLLRNDLLLLLIGLITITLGVLIFRKRNLPL